MNTANKNTPAQTTVAVAPTENLFGDLMAESAAFLAGVSDPSDPSGRSNVALDFLAYFLQQVEIQNAYARELPITKLVVKWCEKYHAKTPDRATPERTVLAQLGELRKRNALPAGVVFKLAKERRKEVAQPGVVVRNQASLTVARPVEVLATK